MKEIKSWLLVIFGLMSLTGCYEHPVPKAPLNTAVVCFTPGSECTQDVISNINQAQKNILMQSNALTSTEIAKALVTAKQRNVTVNVLLDKYQLKQKNYSLLKYLSNQNIPIWIDYKPSIANNKVLIIDNQKVITGSFNFAQANQEKNAANLLIIQDPNLAKTYAINWQSRQSDSTTLAQYLNTRVKSIPKKIVKSKNSVASR